MVENANKKRVCVEPALHKQLKLLAIELDLDLQDLIALALELFVTKCANQQKEETEQNGE